MDHKLRKKLIHERNKRHQLIYQHAEQHKETAQAAIDATYVAPPPPPETSETPVWSARTQEIRNRLTGKKHMARERWNRGAGTSGSGGMGR